MTSASGQGVTVGRRPGGARGVTLIELVVVVAILSVVGGMLVFTWIALSNSFANTTRSSDARDSARLAMSRMERELRDAEAQVTTGHYKGLPAVLWASANQVTIVTTFNDAGNDVPEAKPLAVNYYLRQGTLYMQRDANDDGTWDSAPRSLVPNMVNSSVGASGATPVFSYTYIGDDGKYETANPTDDASNLSAYERGRIVSVTIMLLADLNPGHSPTHVTLRTTAQLRNQRQF